VDGPKDAGEQLVWGRIFSQLHEVAVELVKSLAAFDQELLNKLLHCALSQSPRQMF